MILVVVFIGLTLSSCKKENITLITENKSYIVVNDNKIDIILYIEDKYCFFLEPDNIDSLYLKDKTNRYELTINNLTKGNGKIKYNELELNEYCLNVLFNYEMQDILKIPKCQLEINSNNQTIVVDIGSFSYLNICLSNNLYSSSYKGIVNDLIVIDNIFYPTITGVVLTLNNLNNKEINIKNILPINGHMEVEQIKIKSIDNINVENNIKIDELIDGKYNFIYQNSNEDLNFIMETGKQQILIPISYTNAFMSNNIIFIIEYEIDDKTYYAITTNMILFNSTKLNHNFNVYVVN